MLGLASEKQQNNVDRVVDVRGKRGFRERERTGEWAMVGERERRGTPESDGVEPAADGVK